MKRSVTGTVVTSAYNDGYGNYVTIKDADGYEIRYAHLSSRSVEELKELRKAMEHKSLAQVMKEKGEQERHDEFIEG